MAATEHIHHRLGRPQLKAKNKSNKLNEKEVKGLKTQTFPQEWMINSILFFYLLIQILTTQG